MFQQLSLKPNHASVQLYYEVLGQFGQLHIDHEMAVRSAFQQLLEKCGRQFRWTLVPEFSIKRPKGASIKADGALLDDFRLRRGLWEAKDEHDNLEKEAKHKIAAGYPTENIIFQAPERAILYQNGIRQGLNEHAGDKSTTKWDIFYYVYAVLHHPTYREYYAANLKQDLPKIPFLSEFRRYVDAGKQLATIHVHYDKQKEYLLQRVEQKGEKLNWHVEKMKLSNDKASLIYNEFLTLKGIPAEALEYRLGNRSALVWVIDQYQNSTDQRSGVTSDPNQADDPERILRLIGQVITVSIETVRIVHSLPAFVVSNERKSPGSEKAFTVTKKFRSN